MNAVLSSLFFSLRATQSLPVIPFRSEALSFIWLNDQTIMYIDTKQLNNR